MNDSQGELLVTGARPGKGKSAMAQTLAALLLAGGESLTFDGAFVQPLNLLQGEQAFGVAAKHESILSGFTLTSGANKAEPVCGMDAVKVANIGKGQAGSACNPVHDAKLTCNAGNGGGVHDAVNSICGEVAHGDDAAHVAEVCNSQPEAQAEKAVLPA